MQLQLIYHKGRKKRRRRRVGSRGTCENVRDVELVHRTQRYHGAHISHHGYQPSSEKCHLPCVLKVYSRADRGSARAHVLAGTAAAAAVAVEWDGAQTGIVETEASRALARPGVSVAGSVVLAVLLNRAGASCVLFPTRIAITCSIVAGATLATVLRKLTLAALPLWSVARITACALRVAPLVGARACGAAVVVIGAGAGVWVDGEARVGARALAGALVTAAAVRAIELGGACTGDWVIQPAVVARAASVNLARSIHARSAVVVRACARVVPAALALALAGLAVAAAVAAALQDGIGGRAD